MAALAGKAALVTGGSRGIGAAIARGLARAGASVALTYLHSGEQAQAVTAEIEAAGGRARAIRVDSSDPAAVERAVRETTAAFGRLDILVNNAGIFKGGPIEEQTIAVFDEIIAVNVRAAYAASLAAAAVMEAGGRIISIGSNLADRSFVPGMTLYALSKSALIGLTRGLARDLGPRGVTVNLVQPGSTDTDMNPADGPTADLQRNTRPIARFADPAEIASMVVWLAGPESGFVTGAALTIDGGTNA
jgi:3-oxoacyl-[acyl-carrier protein] reductase